MANISSGEVGVCLSDGREFTFRPSFRALSEMGDVKQLWADMQSNSKYCQLHAAGIILDRCMVDFNHNDFDSLFGYAGLDDDGEVFVTDGEIPEAERCILAFSLLRNGIIGSETPKKSGSEDSTFNPIDWVGASMSTFGQDSKTSWDLTMHEFQAAMKAKYPEAKEQFTPEKASDFLQEMDDLRAKRNG